MTLLIYSGLLYLLGVSTILAFKPEIMFSKDGNWKEFGLGRNNEKYTWLPFWLFAILWAIMSYIIILVIASNTGLGGVTNNINVQNEMIEPENVSMKPLSTSSNTIHKKKPSSVEEMKEGYYILDANETMKRGVPKYIYLGPQAPNLVYHNTSNQTEAESN
jgi:hypothetical protein